MPSRKVQLSLSLSGFGFAFELIEFFGIGDEGVGPAAVLVDDLVDLAHDADGLVESDDNILVVVDVLVGEDATNPLASEQYRVVRFITRRQGWWPRLHESPSTPRGEGAA